VLRRDSSNTSVAVGSAKYDRSLFRIDGETEKLPTYVNYSNARNARKLFAMEWKTLLPQCQSIDEQS
jgi:hypothetical protein